MIVEKKHVEEYLATVKALIKRDKYQISLGENRTANTDLFYTYNINEAGAKDILLSLSVEDFSEVVPNRKPEYEHERLYIFGKNVKLSERIGHSIVQVKLYIKFNNIENQYVVVISFHEQKHSLNYPFKDE